MLIFPLCAWLVQNEKNVHTVYKLKRFWARSISFLVGIKFLKKGKANLPTQPSVICANHASYLDILGIYYLMPNTTVFLGKAELLKWPIVRVFFKHMDIPVDRTNKKKAMQSIELTKQAIQKGYNVVIFPEGLIPADNLPKMHEFKQGAFNLAVSQQAPIIPITFLNSWKLLTDHTDIFGAGSPGIANCIVHEPIHTTNLTDQDIVSLKNKTFQVIEEPLKKYYK